MATDFGSDISCVTDIDPTCAMVTGHTLLAQAIARRLITPRGRLIGDPNYGTDITNMVNDDLTLHDVGVWRTAIVTECMKDERIVRAKCDIDVPPNGTGKYTITIELEAGNGPFELTLKVDDVTVELLTPES